MGEYFEWEEPTRKKNTSPSDGEIRIVNLPVKALFVYSNNIPVDWDDDGTVLETESGYIMRVMNDQSFKYKGEESVLLHTVKEDV